MRLVKRGILVLTVFLILWGSVFVEAKEVPSFTAELKSTYEGFGIYGTLSEMTEDMAAITPCYSTDGKTYMAEEYNDWQIDLEDIDLLSQQCFWASQEPLKAYLEGDIDSFYICLKITYEDGSEYDTEPVLFERKNGGRLPSDYRVEGRYGSSICMFKLQPYKVWGQYYITASEYAKQSEIMAMLPQKIPVELSFFKDNLLVKQVDVYCNVKWSQMTQVSEDCIEVMAQEIIPPEESGIVIGGYSYYYNAEQWKDILFYGKELKAIVQLVKPFTQSGLILSEGVWGLSAGGIRGTLPLRPSGARGIVLEYSLDGGEHWIKSHDILQKYPLDSVSPKIKSYTAVILEPSQQPLKDYLDGDIPGFSIRLNIEGGVLGGISKTEAWPVDYDYVPPMDNTVDGGSGGNENNAGSGDGSYESDEGEGSEEGSSVGDSSGNGGQRPGISEEAVKPILPSIEKPGTVPVGNPNTVPEDKQEVPSSEKPVTPGIPAQDPTDTVPDNPKISGIGEKEETNKALVEERDRSLLTDNFSHSISSDSSQEESKVAEQENTEGAPQGIEPEKNTEEKKEKEPSVDGTDVKETKMRQDSMDDSEQMEQEGTSFDEQNSGKTNTLVGQSRSAKEGSQSKAIFFAGAILVTVLLGSMVSKKVSPGAIIRKLFWKKSR